MNEKYQNRRGNSEGLYFRQLLSGRDFGCDNRLAQEMVNFVYLIGDRKTGDAVIVDPAYAVADILSILETDGMRCKGVLATHHHPDHVGGSMMGFDITGVRELLDEISVPVHAHREEAEYIQKVTGLSAEDIVEHDSGDYVSVGGVEVELIHTPGHTPGSQCFLVQNRLVAGDTRFLDGCGRTDLPGGDPVALYESINQRLLKVSDEAVLYPGHLYSPQPSATMGHTRANNHVFVPKTEEQWLRMFARL